MEPTVGPIPIPDAVNAWSLTTLSGCHRPGAQVTLVAKDLGPQ